MVRAESGSIIAGLTGNGMTALNSLAFDGRRVLAMNAGLGPGGVSLWDAVSLVPGGFVPTTAIPLSVASDGINSWIAFVDGTLLRF